jgi:4-hydroxybenzoate polyprenyltransferase
MDGFTDIRATGWVSRLPPRYVPYAILARFDRPIGSWLLFLPGLWSICLFAPSFWGGFWLLLLFGIGAVVMRGAGCVVNDLWDRKMDREVERTRTRPLASGALRPRDALVFLAILCAIGLLILLQLDFRARILGVISLIPVVLYPLAKRVTWWPQVVLGVTFGWAAPMGFAAATGHFVSFASVCLYAAAILWILGYDTIYAHQDREDDALIGVKSTARLFAHNTRQLLAASYGGMMALLLVTMAITHAHAVGYLVLALPAALLAWQIIRLDVNNPARCLQLFTFNREVGLAVGLAFLVARF